MNGFENFKIRTTLLGTNSREEKINDARHILALEFQNDPSFCDTMYRWIPGVHPHLGGRIDIRIFNRSYSAVNGYTAKFEIQIQDQPDIGDYYFDTMSKQYWICTELYNMNQIYIGGKLTLCNWFLRWQNEIGEIIEYPCSDINSTQYNSGESGNQTITLGSAQHMATVQATSDTICLRSPQRFFISRDYTIPFKVTQNDTVANNYGNGLCKITLTQDVLNPKVDRPDLGLCDYKPPRPHPPKPDETLDLSAIIIGDNKLKNGFTREYTVVFKDSNGDTKDDVDFQWNVVSDFDVIQTVSEQQISLMVNNEDCIGSSFLLQVIKNKTILSEIPIEVIDAF